MTDALLAVSYLVWLGATLGLAATAWPRWRGGAPGGMTATLGAGLTLAVPATLAVMSARPVDLPGPVRDGLTWAMFAAWSGGQWLFLVACVAAWRAGRADGATGDAA